MRELDFPSVGKLSGTLGSVTLPVAAHSVPRWSTTPKPTHFMGSAVAYNGLVAMTSEDGDTFLLKAGPKHEIVRTNTIDEPVYASLAIANGRIYIRGEKHLYAVGN